MRTSTAFEQHMPNLGLITHYSEFGQIPVHKIALPVSTGALPKTIHSLIQKPVKECELMEFFPILLRGRRCKVVTLKRHLEE